MTKLTLQRGPFFIDRDEFITPFDKMFDAMFEEQFPEVVEKVGVTPYQGSAYPKVNVYEYDDKVGIIAEIPGLEKKQIKVEVEDGVLTISGDKHTVWDEAKAKVLRRELNNPHSRGHLHLGSYLMVIRYQLILRMVFCL